MLKRVRTLVGWMLLFAATAIAAWMAGRARPPRHPPTVLVDLRPTLEQIQPLSQLTTLRVTVTDVCVVDIRGRTGGIRAVLVVRGETALGTDLQRAELRIVDAAGHRAVLWLDPPVVLSARVDHQRTRVAMLQSTGLWLIVPSGGWADAAVLELGFREAEAVVARAAAGEELDQKARRQAETIIGEFGRSLGWTVRCEWRPP